MACAADAGTLATAATFASRRIGPLIKNIALISVKNDGCLPSRKRHQSDSSDENSSEMNFFVYGILLHPKRDHRYYRS